jgi:SAM-dependent MidA family methyltransferase
LIGLSLAQAWIDQGSPEAFSLLELGPGRGTLMADILRATRGVKGFHQAAQVTLLEASVKLRTLQGETLNKHTPIWIDTAEDIPPLPLFAVANEFFDALPISQFVRDGTGWRERQVGLSDNELAFGLGPNIPQPALAHRLDDTKDGDLIEDCAAAAPIVKTLGLRIKQNGGIALIIDYGDWRSLGDTIQAIKYHEHVSPLEKAGQCDITAHVDFEAIAKTAPCAYSRLTPQGVFLERLGITQRAQQLANNMTEDALHTHISAHRRLTHPDEMGTLFKVIGLYPEGGSPPAGLEK